MFLDPNAFELAGCVDGGLEGLPGRWFVRDPESTFDFLYPNYEGDCDSGFKRSFASEDDIDESDGRSQFTWTDGTRFLTRQSFQFDNQGTPFEFTLTQYFRSNNLELKKVVLKSRDELGTALDSGRAAARMRSQSSTVRNTNAPAFGQSSGPFRFINGGMNAAEPVASTTASYECESPSAVNTVRASGSIFVTVNPGRKRTPRLAYHSRGLVVMASSERYGVIVVTV